MSNQLREQIKSESAKAWETHKRLKHSDEKSAAWFEGYGAALDWVLQVLPETKEVNQKVCEHGANASTKPLSEAKSDFECIVMPYHTEIEQWKRHTTRKK